MDVLQETIAVYERLRKKRYRIIIDTGEEITFSFQPANYHHLAGFQHLTDFQSISSPQSKDLFYRLVKRQQVQTEYIQKSSCFHEIAERLNTFNCLEDILAKGDEKNIVEYDRSKLSSEIEAKYYLYKRVGSVMSGDVHTTFCSSAARTSAAFRQRTSWNTPIFISGIRNCTTAGLYMKINKSASFAALPLSRGMIVQRTKLCSEISLLTMTSGFKNLRNCIGKTAKAAYTSSRQQRDCLPRR